MSETTKIIALSANTQSRFASVVHDAVCPGSIELSAARLCPCTSVVLEAMHEASWGPLEGAVSAQKALQGSESLQDGDKEVPGRNEREKYFPDEGSMICPPGK